MATPWPQVIAWPTDLREHAIYLSDYLRKALVCIDSAENEPVPTPVVKTMIAATSVLITKLQNTPDMSAIMEALASVQNDLKTTAEIAYSTVARTITHQQIATLSQETNQFVKATAEERRTTTALIQETNDITKEINDNTKVTNNIVKAIQSTPSSKASYASVLTSNTAPLSKLIILSTQTSSFVQAQCEIIVKITDPATIESLRAKSPRNLQNHIDRAIEQSRNEYIERIRVALANQLKSGDLSIKTSSRNEAEALRQFANNWMSRIGRGASIRLPIYGVLVYGIRTSSMDMEKFEEIRAELLHDNRPFIPNADIKYIGWLSRAALTKAASTIIIEFTNPEDANKIIDEAYDARQPYHFVPSTKEKSMSERVTFGVTPAESAAMTNGSQRGRPNTNSTGPSLTPSLPPNRQNARSKSPTKGRAPKRIYTGAMAGNTQDENGDTIMSESSQRPRRPHMPSRRALDSTEETCNGLAETMQKANVWAKRHASVFVPSKFQLTHHIRRPVIIPQMMYGCSAWSVAQGNETGYTKQTIDSLKRLQAKAARIIGGAHKATSGPALDIELHLLPIEQQIWKTSAETVGRILSTNKMPTLTGFRYFRNTRSRRRQIPYLSPLEHTYRRLYQSRGATIEEQEPIPPYVAPPWWQGPSIRIASNAKTAKKQHKESLKHSSNRIFIYTDGSGIDNQVGAAAVSPLTRSTKMVYMGNSETSTVYAAELQGIKLALQIADEDAEKGSRRDKPLKPYDSWNKRTSLGSLGDVMQYRETKWNTGGRLKV
ncbi:reverse transcriptase protein [Rutstroemia sp. NJR-2017a WRK4]|nr:reverse transcriptase protein [Rutstroemia sp. NJR-2017a WRK4]